MRWVGHAARIEQMENTYKSLVGRPEGTKPLGRHRHNEKCNINMNFKEILFEDPNWIYLAHVSVNWRSLINTVINLLVPRKARKFLTS
jgi:hypothetical protein